MFICEESRRQKRLSSEQAVLYHIKLLVFEVLILPWIRKLELQSRSTDGVVAVCNARRLLMRDDVLLFRWKSIVSLSDLYELVF